MEGGKSLPEWKLCISSITSVRPISVVLQKYVNLYLVAVVFSPPATGLYYLYNYNWCSIEYHTYWRICLIAKQYLMVFLYFDYFCGHLCGTVQFVWDSNCNKCLFLQGGILNLSTRRRQMEDSSINKREPSPEIDKINYLERDALLYDSTSSIN